MEEESGKEKPRNIGEGLQNFMDGRNENDPVGLVMKLALKGVMIHEKSEEIKKSTEDFSQEVFSEMKEVTHSYTNDQLVKFFAESNSAEWHKNPAFYRAIINEVQERLHMIVKGKE